MAKEDAGLELMQLYQALRSTRDETVRAAIKQRIRVIVEESPQLKPDLDQPPPTGSKAPRA